MGRAKDGRRDEKILFAALTRIETFTPWLEALREAEANLAGVFSVPLVLAGCGSTLIGDVGPVLFISLSRGGVRHSFFDQGKLHFSRLSQLATRSLDEVGRVCATDSAKIFQYLVAQRQIPRGAALRTVILAHPGQTQALQDYCQNTTDLKFEFVDLAATARQLQLKDIPTDSNADNLFLHCLATKTPAQQFAAADQTRFHKLWQIRSALTSAGWIVLAGCLLFAGKTGLTIHDLREQIDATRAIAATDTQRYQSILEGLPQVNLTPDNLRALTGRVEALQKRIPAMEPLLEHLGTAMNESPRIELVRLTWKMADYLDPAGKAQPDARRNAGTVPAAAPATVAGWVILELEAQLPLVLVSDRRAQLDLIDSFAARLRNPQTEVKVLSRPFDIESDKPLRSTSDTYQAQAADIPKFSVRIARPL
jgi:hypothetical protein